MGRFVRDGILEMVNLAFCSGGGKGDLDLAQHICRTIVIRKISLPDYSVEIGFRRGVGEKLNVRKHGVLGKVKSVGDV